MIILTSGNILNDNSISLVNPVNTYGTMGKGLAKLFKEAYPDNFILYRNACIKKQVIIGRMFITSYLESYATKWIVNFPTKNHWKFPSRIEWIEQGLEDLREFIIYRNIPSVAIPALGCGNGSLNWKDVQMLLYRYLSDLKTDIKIYKPE